MSVCNYCKRRFNDAKTFKQHVQWHIYYLRDKDLLECRKCNMYFADYERIKHHLKTSTKHQFCHVCNWDFDSPSDLKKHLTIHDSWEIYVATYDLKQECSLTQEPTQSMKKPRLRKSATTANVPRAPVPGLTCSICLDHGEDLSCTSCGHIFCTDCVSRALRSRMECPLCRKTTTVLDLRRIFPCHRESF